MHLGLQPARADTKRRESVLHDKTRSLYLSLSVSFCRSARVKRKQSMVNSNIVRAKRKRALILILSLYRLLFETIFVNTERNNRKKCQECRTLEYHSNYTQINVQ